MGLTNKIICFSKNEETVLVCEARRLWLFNNLRKEKKMKPDISVEVAGIRMKNPVMPASGTFSFGEEFSRMIDISKLGAVVIKGTTLLPREGNPQPRSYETIAGMINFIGLQNPGAKRVIQEKIPFLRQFGVPIIVNIAGATVAEYEQLAHEFNGVEGVEGLEINISCPNTKRGGMAFGQSPETTFEVITKVRKSTSLPLIVKLTPNVTDIVLIAKSAVDAGADSLSLINTIKARAKIKRGPSAGKWIEGGLSGPAIKPVALKMVSEIAKANLGVAIIGMGGISNFEDFLEFLESGADAVAVGTANFINHHIMEELIRGLDIYLAERNLTNITELKRSLVR